ncbi:beta family protein [Providencia sp. PROV141]|uniref:beta family protein n=1 Tax=Providencia sp. PROV141 TaxID=2949851 RepID=UPI00234B7449|nr:beta family protein [Providencia sp. PROV141]
MSFHHYYPQLKWKPAEYESLMLLEQATIGGLTPIITIPDIDWDYENECYKKSLNSYLSNFGSNLASSWITNRPILLDVKYLDIHGTSRQHPLDMCIKDARANGKEIIPVISPVSSQNYIHAVGRNLTNGIAVSVNPQTWHLFGQLINQFNIHPSLVDVIIDFGDIQEVSPSLQQQALNMFDLLVAQAHWRSLIVSSTSYPTSQAGIPQHQLYHIPRHEYNLWLYVAQNTTSNRTPSFSDYPTSSSTITSVDPRFMSQYVAIRYSDDTSWIFVKGTAVRGNGWSQTRALCNILTSSAVYAAYGPLFSWGDDYINQRAHGTNKSGASKEWRKVAHTHHLKLVVTQLISLAQTLPVKP